jgi:hypothetical protein
MTIVVPTLEQVVGQIGGRMILPLSASIARRVAAASAAGRPRQEIDEMITEETAAAARLVTDAIRLHAQNLEGVLPTAKDLRDRQVAQLH